MKTQNKKLSFNKSTLVQLNENELQNVNGGGTTTSTVGPISPFIPILIVIKS